MEEQQQATTAENNNNNNRREYFREYMRSRYKANPQKARAYKKTLRLMKSGEANTVNAKDYEKFGIYLADVIKMRAMISSFPPEIVKHLLSA